MDVVATREPGGTPLGDELRAIFVRPNLRANPLAEAFIVNASRAQHVDTVIEPALAAGSYVLCDRFAHATYAYQGYGRGLELGTLRNLVAIATRGRSPDLTFLLDVPVGLSRERVRTRTNATRIARDRLEREDVSFHERVRAGYLSLAAVDERIVTLDGTQSADVLLAAACASVLAKFGE